MAASAEVYLIYDHFLNSDKKTVSIGGIQTYILNLIKVLQEEKYKIYVVQKASENFLIENSDYNVIGIAASNHSFPSKAVKTIEERNLDALVVFCSEELATKYKGKSIAIQHGIYWDKPNHRNYPYFINRMYVWRRARQALKEIKRISYADKVVAVDYNFVNWYRTQVSYPETDLEVIPNFSQVPPFLERDDAKINIIFARRLFDYRGTRVMGQAMMSILQKYGDRVNLTVAGEGPDKDYLENLFHSFENVSFVQYQSEDSIRIHQEHNIALIPTIGSEGTSLSLLEAMAAGCAVICSNVGGMTNIVLDGFNGLMVKAGDAAELENAVSVLVDDAELRKKLALNAYQTVKGAFSVDAWKKRWKNVINEIK